MRFSILGAAIAALLATAESSGIKKRETPGCGVDYPERGKEVIENQFYSGGLRREYSVNVPKNYQKDEPTGLILAYHGSLETTAHFARSSRLHEPKINPNMIVVYVSGIDVGKKLWQGFHEVPPERDDKGFTRDLIKRLKDRLCIDEDRVYGVGLGGGGGLLNMVACDKDVGREFAAMALVSPVLIQDLNDTFCDNGALPMPIWHLHGTNDGIQHWNGNPGRPGGALPPVPDWQTRWLKRNKCDLQQTPREQQLKKGITVFDYTCQGNDRMFEHVKVEGHGEFYMGEHASLNVSPLILSYLGNQTRPRRGEY